MDKVKPIFATGTRHKYNPPPLNGHRLLNHNDASADRIRTIKCQCSLRRGGMNITTRPPPSVHQLISPKHEESLRDKNQIKSQSRLRHGHNNTNPSQRPPFALTSALRKPTQQHKTKQSIKATAWTHTCLLYTSPSPRDQRGSRMPSSA